MWLTEPTCPIQPASPTRAKPRSVSPAVLRLRANTPDVVRPNLTNVTFEHRWERARAFELGDLEVAPSSDAHCQVDAPANA